MTQKDFAIHEVLEVHEILTIKNVCAAKSSIMQGLAADKKLKGLLEDDARMSQKAVKQLKAILEEAK
ncbi:hypothetical protein [Bacillus solitudinis]|uniref:hypothetical protein n=1 Tax=Bacillus solitudinis TaxID=2014074 RepID=UPI000C23D3C2|nr:hypothetical protein [Bacillus solitudinis]